MLSYHLLSKVLAYQGDAPNNVLAYSVSSAIRGLLPHDSYVALADRTDRRALPDSELTSRVSLLLRYDGSLLLDLIRACETEQQFATRWNALNFKLPLGVTTQIRDVVHGAKRTCLSGKDSALREHIMEIFIEQLHGLQARYSPPERCILSRVARELCPGEDLHLELIDCLFESPTSDLTECISELGCSKRTLQRQLSALGLTFLELRHAVRLVISKDLLRDPKDSMTSIAIASGFYDAPHFCRAFRSSCGMSPSDYRTLSYIGSS